MQILAKLTDIFKYISGKQMITLDIIDEFILSAFRLPLDLIDNHETKMMIFQWRLMFFRSIWETYDTSASEHFKFLPNIIRGYILDDLSECGIDGFNMLVKGLEYEALQLIKCLLPPSIMHILKKGKLDKVIEIFRSVDGVTTKDIQKVIYAWIAQVIWDNDPELSSKIL